MQEGRSQPALAIGYRQHVEQRLVGRESAVLAARQANRGIGRPAAVPDPPAQKVIPPLDPESLYAFIGVFDRRGYLVSRFWRKFLVRVEEQDPLAFGAPDPQFFWFA